MKEKEEKEAEQKRKEVSAKPMRAKQLPFAESFKGKSRYDKKSERYLTIMKHLVMCPMASLRMLNSSEREMFSGVVMKNVRKRKKSKGMMTRKIRYKFN